MEPHPLNLRLLKVANYLIAPRVPRWIGSLENLQHLELGLEELGSLAFSSRYLVKWLTYRCRRDNTRIPYRYPKIVEVRRDVDATALAHGLLRQHSQFKEVRATQRV
jgi:hypothetical protein